MTAKTLTARDDNKWINTEIAKDAGFRPTSEYGWFVACCHCGKKYQVNQTRRILRHERDHKNG